MKKSLTALAVLACCTGAAMAQSSITLYGRIDTSVGSDKDKAKDESVTKMFSGNLTTSRIGLKGSEEIADGVKANFNLEAKLNSDDGSFAAGGMTFDRQSWVGLSGGFGALKLGRSDSAYKDIRDLSVSSNVWDSAFTPLNIAYAAGLKDYTSRPANQVRYESPNVFGFTLGATYSMDEDEAVKKDIAAYNLRYRIGQFDIGVAHQKQKDSAALANELEFTTVAAAYNFGVLRVSGDANVAENGLDQKDNEYSVGVSVPLDPVEFSVGYANSKSENAAGTTVAKSSAIGAAVTYAFSKRTRLYVGMIDGEVEDGAGVTTKDRRMYSAGVRHDF